MITGTTGGWETAARARRKFKTGTYELGKCTDSRASHACTTVVLVYEDHDNRHGDRKFSQIPTQCRPVRSKQGPAAAGSSVPLEQTFAQCGGPCDVVRP
jgi:hypothetical protein